MNIVVHRDKEKNRGNMSIQQITSDILADFDNYGNMLVGYPNKLSKYISKIKTYDVPTDCKWGPSSNYKDDRDPPSSVPQPISV